MIAALALAAYIATIPAANWMIGHVGTVCIPEGPCLIPVGFGLEAPSGVLLVGLALALRDVVQLRMGRVCALMAIVSGAVLSAMVAPAALVAASAAAFLLSELADFAVYTPLAERRLTLAVLASGVVGAVVDSAVFLYLAFGSFDFMAGQVLGKVEMTVVGAAIIWMLRRRGLDAMRESPAP